MDKLFLVQFSACLAETITFPIDYFKTLLQVNHQKSIQPVLETIKQNKYNIYQGLKPSLVRHSIYTTIRINLYEQLRNNTGVNSTPPSVITKFMIGGLSGGISQMIATPFDLLKVQYITNPAMNQYSMYRNLKTIFHQNGILGIYRGTIPNVSRAVLVNFGEIATYDLSKKNIQKYFQLKDDYKLHISSSIVSGFVSSLLCTPADVVKSRMMKYNSEYKNIIDCIIFIKRNEGVAAFYKGFFPIWFRLAPWQLTFWVSYEKTRNLLNIEPF